LSPATDATLSTRDRRALAAIAADLIATVASGLRLAVPKLRRASASFSYN